MWAGSKWRNELTEKLERFRIFDFQVKLISESCGNMSLFVDESTASYKKRDTEVFGFTGNCKINANKHEMQFGITRTTLN